MALPLTLTRYRLSRSLKLCENWCLHLESEGARQGQLFSKCFLQKQWFSEIKSLAYLNVGNVAYQIFLL